MAAEASKDMFDQAACAAIRELLQAHGVPVAAFIDDHVANAIAQRNILASALLEARSGMRHDRVHVVDDALRKAYPSGLELARIGDPVVAHLKHLATPDLPKSAQE